MSATDLCGEIETLADLMYYHNCLIEAEEARYASEDDTILTQEDIWELDYNRW